MAYTKYSLTPANNNAAPPDGAPEGMLPSAVNDTMRDMMAQIRDVGDGIRGGTYTMTAPVITGGSITGVALSGNTLTNPVITGGSINNTTVGATTRSTGAFTTLASNGATTFTAGTASTSTTTGTAVITGGLGVSGRINAANFDGIVGANTAAAGNFTTIGATGVATFSAGTVSAPAITTTGDTNTGIYFPAADTIGFTEGGVEGLRLNSNGQTSTSIAGTASLPSFTRTGDENTGIFFPAADTIAFTEGGVESMRIDSAGNLGLGVTPSATWTGSHRVFQFGSTSSVYSLSGSTAVNENSYNDGTNRYLTTNFATRYLQATGQHIWFNAPSGTAGNAITFTQAMTLDASGNLGIRTTTPSSYNPSFNQLVVGDGSNNNGITIVTGTAAIGSIAFADGTTGNEAFRGYIQYLHSSDAMIYGASGAERMRITAAGDLGVGTTSPSAKLEVSVASPTTGIIQKLFATGATGAQLHLAQSGVADWVIGQPPNVNALAFYTDRYSGNNGSERMRIDSSGNLLVARTSSSRSARVSVLASNAVNDGIFVNGYGSGICNGASFSSASTVATAIEFLYNTTTVGAINTTTTATSYVTSSDYRLKENIAPMTGALGVVAQLKPVTYNWKVDGSSGQGFIAHELQAVVPDCVTGEKDAVDAEGKPVYQGIDTSFLVATLTAAIQEQQAMIEQLTTRLNALEGK